MARNNIKKGKNRHNVSLSDEARQRGDKLAKIERRSFSNLIECLIDREFSRLNPQSN